MSFEQAYEEWKIYATRRHKKQCFETLNQNFNKHVLPYFKDTDILKLTIKDVINWQNNITDLNYSNNYNKNLFSCFKSFLDYCVLNEYISINYLDVIGSFKKKYEPKTHDIYNYFEYMSFRKGLTDLVYKYFFDILFFYGLRSGEAMALRFSDLHGRQLHVGATMHRRGKREIDNPKTPKSNRTILLNFTMLFKLFVLKCVYMKKYGSDLDFFIFGGKTPLSPTTIKRHKHKACINRGIREITTHEFRHSCATRLIKKGMPMDKVSKLLGHSSIAITMDIYVHNEKRDWLSLLSKLDFFQTLNQNFKKILTSIITHFV